jgi:hypothetical protein
VLPRISPIASVLEKLDHFGTLLVLGWCVDILFHQNDFISAVGELAGVDSQIATVRQSGRFAISSILPRSDRKDPHHVRDVARR